MAIPQTIKRYANDIRNKIYGVDVRESLAKGIEVSGEISEESNDRSKSTAGRQNKLETRYDVQVGAMTEDSEIIDARVGADGERVHNNIKNRLDYEYEIQLDRIKEIGLTPEDFGAIGDGVTDDTAALQRAIDYTSQNNLKIIIAKNKKYKVSKTGTVTYDLGRSQNKADYALVVRDNTHIDFNESIFLFDNADYGSIMINEGLLNKPKTFNRNVTLDNLIFEGNSDGVSIKNDFYSPALNLVKIKNLRVNNAEFRNLYDCGMSILASEDLDIDKIRTRNIKGNGIYLGTESETGYEDLRVHRAVVGTITCTDIREGKPDRSANPVIGCLKDSTVGTISVKNSFWGIKIQNESDTLNIESVIFDGGDLSENNSGLRIQGKSDENLLKNINIGNVISKNCGGSGLYVQYSKNVNIGSYIGENNGLLGEYTDVWLHKEKVSIDSIKIIDAHSGGVQIRKDSEDIKIGSITATDVRGPLISDESHSASIGDVTLKTTKPYFNTTYLYAGPFVNGRTIINKMRVLLGDSQNYINISSKLTRINRLEIAPSEPLEFEMTLSPGTRTEIMNNNIIYQSNGAGDFVRPFVEIIQLSGEPINIANQIYVLGGYRLTHSQALGTEKIMVRIREVHI